MAIRGIGRKPPATSRIPWLPLSLSMPAEARCALLAMGLTWDVDARILGSLIRGFQNAGTWDKYQAIYPFYPARAASAVNHMWNLRDPRDVDAAFRLTYSGTVTHAATGISTSTGSCDPKFTPLTNGVVGDSHLSAYVTGATAGFCSAIGAYDANTWEWGIGLQSGTTFFPALNTDSVYPSATIATTQGWLVATRTNTTTIRGYLNGTEVVNGAQAVTANVTQSLRLIAKNDGGTINANMSPGSMRFATIGLGLTAQNVTDDYATIDAYQRALGRNV
jgi:hypothetical protein